MTDKQASYVLGAIVSVSVCILLVLSVLVYRREHPSVTTTTETHQNILLQKKLHEANVMSGIGNNIIGTYAYIEIPLDELSQVSEEDFAEFCREYIDANTEKYNYFIIYTTSSSGIIFYGCSSFIGDYGDIDSSQTITNITATITYNFDTNKYEYTTK